VGELDRQKACDLLTACPESFLFSQAVGNAWVLTCAHRLSLKE